MKTTDNTDNTDNTMIYETFSKEIYKKYKGHVAHACAI